ncbi:hypothetical protein FRC12_022799 [Ceratobasidium sp. 428]|nr:hypothetical protein FRC12_022799 [Ceratobasidium sp. 428]
MRRTRSGHGTISFQRRNLRVDVSNLLGSPFFIIRRLLVFVSIPSLFRSFLPLRCASTDFDLSQAGRTSHETRAALLQLRSSDPQFYAEITSGSPIVISDTEARFEDVGVAEGVADEDNDSVTLTVADLRKAFMSATSASEIASSN